MDKVESKHSLPTFVVKPNNANAGYFDQEKTIYIRKLSLQSIKLTASGLLQADVSDSDVGAQLYLTGKPRAGIVWRDQFKQFFLVSQRTGEFPVLLRFHFDQARAANSCATAEQQW